MADEEASVGSLFEVPPKLWPMAKRPRDSSTPETQPTHQISPNTIKRALAERLRARQGTQSDSTG